MNYDKIVAELREEVGSSTDLADAIILSQPRKQWEPLIKAAIRLWANEAKASLADGDNLRRRHEAKQRKDQRR